MPNANVSPTFRIFDKHHKLQKTLVHAFTKERAMTKDDYLNLRSFTLKGVEDIYKVEWDDSVFPDLCDLPKNESLHCIISFQKHTFGCYAVIKKARVAEHA